MATLSSDTYPQALIALGLDASSAEILACLIKHSWSDVSYIASKTDLSKSKVYQTLKQLEAEGAVYRSRGRPARFTVAAPFLKVIQSRADKLLSQIMSTPIDFPDLDIQGLIENVKMALEENKYKIKDVPEIDVRIGFPPIPNVTPSRVFDFIAEGDYRIAVGFIDQRKSRLIREILAIEFYPIFDLMASLLNCIDYFLIVHNDFEESDRFFEFLTEALQNYEHDRFRMAPRQSRYSGIEGKSPTLIRTTDDVSAIVEHTIKDLRNRRFLADRTRAKVTETLTQTEEEYLNCQVIARNIPRILTARTGIRTLKGERLPRSPLFQFKEPILRIVQREQRNIKIVKHSYILLTVKLNDILKQMERRCYLPMTATIEKELTNLQLFLSKFKAIKYELSSLERILISTSRNLILEPIRVKTINPFIFTIPYEIEPYTINQEDIDYSFKEFLNSILMGEVLKFRFLVGQEGIGKTHLLKYLLIPAAREMNLLPIYIECPLGADLLPNLVSKLLEKKNFPDDWKEDIEEITIEPNLTPGDAVLILGKLESLAEEAGYKGIVVIIDEFENSLPDRLFGTPSDFGITSPISISQLREVLQTELLTSVGVVISYRSKVHPTVRNYIGIANFNDFVYKPKPLSLKDIQKLISYRMETWNVEVPRFTPGAIEVIYERSERNTRNVIRYCRELFSIAVELKNKTVTKELVADMPPIPRFTL